MKVIARTNTSTPARCALFTLQKRGLAFNFSPSGIMENEDNCLVCDCPEFDVLASLKKDWRFDYYSLYGYPLPSNNYTCIPKVGLFQINQEQLNFREALTNCRKKDSELAHVVSEIRTSSLATLIKQFGKHGIVKKAYISLQDIKQEGFFKTTIGEPLNCFGYKAWGPSEPRDRLKDEDCAVLDDRKQWRVSRCSQRLPYICELWPGGDILNDITTGLVHCSELDEESLLILFHVGPRSGPFYEGRHL
ncbi:hypothetical protein C0J52_14668 [Blattella germanica]|nr:hypothetical protein C0J52_14668 [Blattella germanica]